MTVSLNYAEIKWNPERVVNIKPFTNKFNWKFINYPAKIDDCKTFEKNNLTIALKILYIAEKEILPAYIWKNNSTREKQIIHLMISNEEKEGWHVVKRLSASLNGIASKQNDDFYCLNCLHSFRTENQILSNFVDNLAEGIHKIKCKYCDCFLEYESVKNNLIKYKWLSFNNDYSNRINEEFKKRFKSTFKFSNNDIDRFILLLRKTFYLYECMDDWEKFNEAILPEKEEFYSNLNMEDITDADYMHAKRVCKDFEIKHLRKYDNLYLKNDTLLLFDVFENFRKVCLKFYHLDPVKFISTSD